MGTIILRTLLIFFPHLFRMMWHAFSNNMGRSCFSIKNGILHAIKKETFPRGFWVFMSRLIPAEDNCFSCCAGTEAVFAITCMLRTLDHSTVMSYTLPANITMEAKPFYHRPDMSKIQRGFYNLLNWLTISLWHPEAPPREVVLYAGAGCWKRRWSYHFAAGRTCNLP